MQVRKANVIERSRRK